MRTRPNGADLLSIARDVFRDELMPHLPDEARYTALMIANAMANAERELMRGDAALQAELDRLRVLYPAAPESEEPVAVQLERLNRHLAVDIRKGGFFSDRARREEIRTHLVQSTLERVRESNPKYLKSEGLE